MFQNNLILIISLLILTQNIGHLNGQSTKTATEYNINLTKFEDNHRDVIDEELGTNLTFVLSASHLPTQDHFSEVDALVKLFYKIGRSGAPIRFGTTDHVMNDPNPHWHQVFSFIWREGTGQKWHFVVRDHDILDRDDDVGDAVVDVDKYVAYGQDVNVSLSHGGFLTISKTQPFSFRLWAENIPSKDGDNGKSDPYVEMYWRIGKNGTNIPFKTTSVVENDHNPIFNFEVMEFPNWQKGTNQYFYFQLYDKDTITRDDLIGDLLMEVDSFVEEKTTKKSILENSNGVASISIALV